MRIFFSELDGTTWEQDFPLDYCAPEIRMPLYPSTQNWMAMNPGDVALTLTNHIYKERRYQRIGFTNTGGMNVAFYDRIVDAEEVR